MIDARLVSCFDNRSLDGARVSVCPQHEWRSHLDRVWGSLGRPSSSGSPQPTGTPYLQERRVQARKQTADSKRSRKRQVLNMHAEHSSAGGDGETPYRETAKPSIRLLPRAHSTHAGNQSVQPFRCSSIKVQSGS